MSGGDATFVLETVDDYLEDATERLVELQAAIQTEDGDRLFRAAHALGSLSGSVGRLALLQYCRQIEAKLRPERASDRPAATHECQPEAAAIARVLEQTREALERAVR